MRAVHKALWLAIVVVAVGLPGNASAAGPGSRLSPADVNTGRPLTPHDHFRIASVTKTFAATAILEQVDWRRLSLEDPINKFVAGVPYRGQVTIRQLLAMRSGVYDYSFDPEFSAQYDADPLLPGFKPVDILKIIRDNPDKATPPGQETVYNNSNYILLGFVLEKVTGRPVAEVINRFVVQRLGLRETSFSVTPAMPETCPPPFPTWRSTPESWPREICSGRRPRPSGRSSRQSRGLPPHPSSATGSGS